MRGTACYAQVRRDRWSSNVVTFDEATRHEERRREHCDDCDSLQVKRSTDVLVFDGSCQKEESAQTKGIVNQ